jgi:hypothetical protein
VEEFAQIYGNFGRTSRYAAALSQSLGARLFVRREGIYVRKYTY